MKRYITHRHFGGTAAFFVLDGAAVSLIDKFGNNLGSAGWSASAVQAQLSRGGAYKEISLGEAQRMFPRVFTSNPCCEIPLGASQECVLSPKPAKLEFSRADIDVIRWLALQDKTGEPAVASLLTRINQYNAQ